MDKETLSSKNLRSQALDKCIGLQCCPFASISAWGQGIPRRDNLIRQYMSTVVLRKLCGQVR